MSSNPFSSLSKFPESIKNSKIIQWAMLISALTAFVTAAGISANQILETYYKHHPTFKEAVERVDDFEKEYRKDRKQDLKTMKIIADQSYYNAVIICRLNNAQPHRSYPCSGLEFLPQPLDRNKISPNSPIFEVRDSFPYSRDLSIDLK